MDRLFFAFNIALFSCIFVLIQFVQIFCFVSHGVVSRPNLPIGFGVKTHSNRASIKTYLHRVKLTFASLNFHNITRLKINFVLQVVNKITSSDLSLCAKLEAAKVYDSCGVQNVELLLRIGAYFKL